MQNETVHKFEFDDHGIASLDIPADARVVHVAEQDGHARLWIRLKALAPRVPRRFMMIGTGWSNVQPHWPHVGSIMLQGGAIVFHIFEETDDAK